MSGEIDVNTFEGLAGHVLQGGYLGPNLELRDEGLEPLETEPLLGNPFSGKVFRR